jgi:hypothetical protein
MFPGLLEIIQQIIPGSPSGEEKMVIKCPSCLDQTNINYRASKWPSKGLEQFKIKNLLEKTWIRYVANRLIIVQ